MFKANSSIVHEIGNYIKSIDLRFISFIIKLLMSLITLVFRIDVRFPNVRAV